MFVPAGTDRHQTVTVYHRFSASSKETFMNNPEKKTIHRLFKEYIYRVLEFLHSFISITIIIAIALTLLSLPQQLVRCTDVDSKSLITFLEYVINVIIAVELIHVMLHQSLDTIVEILSLAITRELIIEKMHTYELFIGVAAIALLFVIRKYLFISSKDKETHTAYEYNAEHEAHTEDNITDPTPWE